MEKVFEYPLPFWHPLAVHFPTALLTVSGLAAVLWVYRGSAFWRRTLLFLLSLGMAGSVVAYLTGETMEERVAASTRINDLTVLHQQMAAYVLIVTGVNLAVLAAAAFYLERRTTIERNPPDPLPLRVLLGIGVLAGAVLVALTARLGGAMVWGINPP